MLAADGYDGPPMAIVCPACTSPIDPESFDDEGCTWCASCASALRWDGALRVVGAATPVRASTLVLLEPAPRWSEADLPSLGGPSSGGPPSDRWLYAVLALATCALAAVITVHLVLRERAGPVPAVSADR
jgi:hypothetical protein